MSVAIVPPITIREAVIRARYISTGVVAVKNATTHAVESGAGILGAINRAVAARWNPGEIGIAQSKATVSSIDPGIAAAATNQAASDCPRTSCGYNDINSDRKIIENGILKSEITPVGKIGNCKRRVTAIMDRAIVYRHRASGCLKRNTVFARRILPKIRELHPLAIH